MKSIIGSTRKHLTYANVMATIAVFIALGGVSYAAVKLPKNSVGTKQIRKNAVTLPKISKSARESLKGQKGDKGDKGADGATGPTGPVGPSDAISIAAGSFLPASAGGLSGQTPELSVGNYTVTAAVTITNNGATVQNPTCDLIAFHPTSTSTTMMTGGSYVNGVSGATGSIALAGAIAITESGYHFNVYCSGSAGAGIVLSTRIVATRVGSINAS